MFAFGAWIRLVNTSFSNFIKTGALAGEHEARTLPHLVAALSMCKACDVDTPLFHGEKLNQNPRMHPAPGIPAPGLAEGLKVRYTSH